MDKLSLHKLRNLAIFFLKINEERFSFQGKQPTIFVAKIQALSES